jgi:hypothetical protein
MPVGVDVGDVLGLEVGADVGLSVGIICTPTSRQLMRVLLTTSLHPVASTLTVGS